MRLLTMKQLRPVKGIPYSRQHIYRLVDEARFPKPLKLSENRIAFVEGEIDDWIEAACVARNNSEARAGEHAHAQAQENTSRLRGSATTNSTSEVPPGEPSGHSS